MVHDCMCGALKKESVCERLEAKKQEEKKAFSLLSGTLPGHEFL